MDDATRKAIEHFIEDGGMSTRTLRLLTDFLREALAREAEKTTPVTPEWLDGAEAKRLGFERVSPLAESWTCCESDPATPIGRMARVELYAGYENMLVQDDRGCRIVVSGAPTIAQVRAAVFLATGRE